MTGWCIFNNEVECNKHTCKGCKLWDTEGNTMTKVDFCSVQDKYTGDFNSYTQEEA